jgi:hypothetical protein
LLLRQRIGHRSSEDAPPASADSSRAFRAVDVRTWPYSTRTQTTESHVERLSRHRA